MKFNGVMYQVHSGNVARIGWEFDNETKQGVLRVEFNKGDQYDYFPVPKEVFQACFKAPSKGKWFHSEIKSNKLYDYEKVDEEDLTK